jgi:toxin FitB
MILVDTNIISEIWRPNPNQYVLSWLESQLREAVFVSAITLAEIHYGIARTPEGYNKARMADSALKLEKETFNGRVLGFDSRCALQFGLVRASREKMGRPINFPDSAIAATAITYGLVLATRNVKDFEGLEMKIVNPFEP